ncbi:MAG: hypothetical protein WA110_02095, partial [Anaerolineaceae bacterium]
MKQRSRLNFFNSVWKKPVSYTRLAETLTGENQIAESIGHEAPENPASSAEQKMTSEQAHLNEASDWQPETPANSSRAQMSLAEDDNTLLVGASSLGEQPRDRHSYERQQVLADCLDAWRFNPLARRIVELTSQHVTGGGMVVRCPHPSTQVFINAFWNHRLNHMDVRLTELSDELVRSGNLFLLLSTDLSGMSYLRVVPTSDIERIESCGNDVEQEVGYLGRTDVDGEPANYPAYDPPNDRPDAQG